MAKSMTTTSTTTSSQARAPVSGRITMIPARQRLQPAIVTSVFINTHEIASSTSRRCSFGGTGATR